MLAPGITKGPSGCSHAAATNHTSDHRHHRQRSKARHQYEKRKSVGLCAYFGCAASAATTHRYCRPHLAKMSESNQRRSQSRKERGLCVSCGRRPQFWGVRCLVCRELFGKNGHPLPLGARRALKLYRNAELQFEIEQRQAHARFAIRKLLADETIRGNRARALYLYAGLDTGSWRTYGEVARVMNLSHERVRQLLYNSKLIVSRMLNDGVPWKPLTREVTQRAWPKTQLIQPVTDSRSSINVQASNA